MEVSDSVSLARKLTAAALLLPLILGLSSCGGGGGGGGGGGSGSGNPTEHPRPEAARALLLDIASLQPAEDVVAVVGRTVPFSVRLGTEHTVDAVGFFWSLDGARVAEGTSDVTIETSGLAVGVHVVQVEVSQGEGDEKEATTLAWRLEVAKDLKEAPRNRPPAILQAFPPGNRTALRGETIELSVAAADVDAGDSLGFVWSLDGSRLEGEDGPDVSLSTEGFAFGPHGVTVEVRDGVEREPSERVSFTWSLDVKDEGAHSLPYISHAWPIGSPRIEPNGRLRFEVEAMVPDAEDMVSFQWEVDGIRQQAAGDTFHLEPANDESSSSGASTDVGAHRITCRLIAGEEEAGEAGDSVGWTVLRETVKPIVSGRESQSGGQAANAPPAITSISPEANPSVVPGESKVFRVAANDADGDILTYRWFVDGVEQPASGPVFAFTGSLAGGAEGARIDVRVSDGRHEEAGATVAGAWDLSLGTLRYLALTLAGGAIILDNGQEGTVPAGNWLNSNAGGAYGTNSLYSKSSTDTYTYNFQVGTDGSYEVLLWWTAWSSRSTSVKVNIHHAGGIATATVDQTVNGGKWSSLGSFDFSQSAKVVIVSSGGDLSTCADAVCLNPVLAADTQADQSGGGGGGGEIIIDDGGAGTSAQGTWSPSAAPNPYGGRSLYARTSGSYTFQQSLSVSGSYDVYAWWTEWPSRDGAVPYEITHSTGTATVKKDQRIDGGKWNLLGRYALSSSAKVTMKVTSDSTFCADAVRFVPAGSAPPPPADGGTGPGDIIVDNGGPGTSADGVWSVSSAPHPYGTNSLYAKDRGAYVYKIALPSSGKYGVYAWYTEWASRESAVPYEILNAGGTATVQIDQRTGGGRWTPLGDFDFGTSARITVRVVDSNTVCADAVRLVPGGGAGTAGGSPPPPPPTSSSPQITDLAAFPLTSTMARVSWRTNFLGNSVVSYGTSSSASDTTRTVSGSRWDHSVLLETLSEDKLYYVKVKTDNGSVSKTSDVVSFRTPDPTPTYTVSSAHPRVFFNQAEIPSIRDRIKNAPYSTWWSAVVSFCNQQLGNSTTTIRDDAARTTECLAFGGLIGDVASYRDKAIAAAMAVASLSTTIDDKELRVRIDHILPVYDWLNAYLTSSQKLTLRSKLVSCASALEDQVKDNEFADGHSNGNENGAFLAALAVYGEDSSAQGIISRALVRYNEGFWPFWREQGSENGGSFKSGWYTTVATQFNYEVFAAWKSATGKNLFQVEKAWFAGLSDWYLHSLRGDMSWDRHGDVVFQQGVDEVEQYILIQIAREFKNSEAQWLAGRIIDFLGVWGPNMVFDILWYDSSVPEKAPTQALSRHFKGCGMVFTRDSWKDDAVQVMFRAVPYYMGGHGHLDQCSFAIFYKDGLALDSGVYDDYGSSHHINYYSRTIAHNAILVTDPNEVFKLYGNTQAADGGQYWLDPQRVPHPFPEVIQDLTNDDSFNIGGVKAYEDTDLYTYALGDGTLAYNPSKMATYFRHFVWLKSLSGWSKPVVVVFDEVESTKSTFLKTYLLHTQNKPSVSGTLVSASSGAGLLYQRTVFPQSPDIQLVGGLGREYWVKDRNYPPTRPPKTGEEAGAWRVEISPTTGRLHDEFLHVLYPTASGASAPPSVRAIDAGAMKGLESQGLVLLFSVKVENVPSVSYTLSGQRRNVLCGLSPGGAHDVYVDGVKKMTVNATMSGILDFTNPSSGKIDVVRK